MGCLIDDFSMSSADNLAKQASATVHCYMRGAVMAVDEFLGEGYAKDHPELVGSIVQACAIDFATGMFTAAVKALLSRNGNADSNDS